MSLPRNLLVVMSVLALVGCSKKEAEPVANPAQAATAAQKEVPAQEPVAAKPPVANPDTPSDTPPMHMASAGEAVFNKLDFDKNAISGMTINGEIQTGLRWEDNSGENVIVFDKATKKAPKGFTTTMTAGHYRKENGAWKSVRSYREVIDSCEFDTRADVVVDPKGWSLTDVDLNGIPEATWAWFSTCTSDVSPATKKIMMTEKDQKYPLRGTTKVDIGNGEFVGGEFKADPAFDEVVPAFLEHAKSVWEKAGN